MKNEIYAPAGTTSRKFWLDNLRWVVVLLVLLYHVIYFYNNKGVFGGIGGFGPYPDVKQYQDVVMYILYPWFMPLLSFLPASAPAMRWISFRATPARTPAPPVASGSAPAPANCWFPAPSAFSSSSG